MSREQEIIAQYFAPLATSQGACGLQDDAATLAVSGGMELVISSDNLLSNVHFFANDPPGLIARKALRRNLSDILAKGAKPLAYNLNLALPENTDEEFLQKFTQGLEQEQHDAGVHLLGGDLSHSPAGIMLSITLFGEIAKGKIIRRNGARPGDKIIVSGVIGDAALGLLLRQGKIYETDIAIVKPLVSRYLLPPVRFELAPLIGQYASASMDISDGLMGDLGQLCAASGLGAEIYLSQIPFSEEAKTTLENNPHYFHQALNGGDDYEILATIPKHKVENFLHEAQNLGCPAHIIGDITASEEVILLDAENQPVLLHSSSYSHFQG